MTARDTKMITIGVAICAGVIIALDCIYLAWVSRMLRREFPSAVVVEHESAPEVKENDDENG